MHLLGCGTDLLARNEVAKVTFADRRGLDGCVDSVVDQDTDGVSFSCAATSDGGTAFETVTVKRDATPPTVTYAGNTGSYTVDEAVAIICTAADAVSPGSGLASHDCADITGDAYTFPLGANAFSAGATDHAGNEGSGAVAFETTVTYTSMCNLTSRFVGQTGVTNSLCAKLNAAAAAAERGNTNAKRGQLNAYVNELLAAVGRWVSADDAAILIELAGAL